MYYKAILSDVDGTLVPVGPHTKPSQRVIDAIQKAKTKVHFSIVSGRPINWLDDLFKILDVTDPCIINGGTQIVNPKTHEILWQQEMNQDDVAKILDISKKYKLHFLVNDNGTEYPDPTDLNFKHPIGIQMQYIIPEEVDTYLEMLKHIPTVAAHKIFSWEKGKNDIYIVHNQATKEHAAKELARIFDITMDEIIGIGDSGNDMPLLNACGLKVALKSGTDELKAIANYIAPSLEEDGVAEVIEKFVLK